MGYTWSDVCREKNGGMKCHSDDACRTCKNEAKMMTDALNSSARPEPDMSCDNCGAPVTQNVHGEIWHIPSPAADKARIAALEKVAKAAFGLVYHDQWGTHIYTDDGMWNDAQKLIDALKSIENSTALATQEARP
jgi:hypothetical protein